MWGISVFVLRLPSFPPPTSRSAPPPSLADADEEYDEFLGIGTGAAALFGTTGGVMEAALRCVLCVQGWGVQHQEAGPPGLPPPHTCEHL